MLYTYIRPYLQQVTGVSTAGVVGVLVLCSSCFCDRRKRDWWSVSDRQALGVVAGILVAQIVVQLLAATFTTARLVSGRNCVTWASGFHGECFATKSYYYDDDRVSAGTY